MRSSLFIELLVNDEMYWKQNTDVYVIINTYWILIAHSVSNPFGGELENKSNIDREKKERKQKLCSKFVNEKNRSKK